MAREIHSTKKCDRPQCAACKKDFRRRSELNRHVRQSHSSVKYSCPVSGCPFKTPRHGKVNNHLRKAHGIDPDLPKGTNRKMVSKGKADSGSGSGLGRPLFNSQQNTITTSSNNLSLHHRNIEYTEAFDRAASTDTVLGSGQWVQQGDIERVQTPPQQLQLSQSERYINPHSETTSTEHNPDIITSWMGDLFEDGWTLNNWNP